MTGPQDSDADSNLYAPPRAQIAQPTQAADAAPFYIVSVLKVVLLNMATFSLYSFYWFWRHWKLHKIDKRLDIWPIPRAIFSLFFAHSLNQEIDHRISRNGDRHRWSPNLWATLYVGAVIASRIADRLPEEMVPADVTLVVTMIAVAAISWALAQAQRAANIACGDPDAQANRRLTDINWLWLVLGGLFWALILLALALPEEAMQ